MSKELVKSSTGDIIENSSQFTQEYANKLIKEYPNRVPIIIWNILHPEINFDDNKRRYIVQKDITFAQFIFIIRKKLSLNSDEALYLFVGNPSQMICNSQLIGLIYNNHQEDGFLRVTIAKESTFG